MVLLGLKCWLHHHLLCACASPTDWYWKSWIRPWTFKIFAIFLVVFSAMVVWSECLFFVSSLVLSVFAWFMALATANYHYFWIEVIDLLTLFCPLASEASCIGTSHTEMFWCLLFFILYSLPVLFAWSPSPTCVSVPITPYSRSASLTTTTWLSHHQTGENSLIFCGMWVAPAWHPGPDVQT